MDLRAKKPLADLEVYGNYIADMWLLWSKDSTLVAYFEPDRRGGTTSIYFRNGSKFEQVEFPQSELGEFDGNSKAEGDEKYLKTTEATTSPKQWLKSRALVVVIDESWLTEGGNEHHCSETVTIAFDANHKASVQSVTDKKVD